MNDIDMLSWSNSIDSANQIKELKKIIRNQELQIELMQIIIKKLYNMELRENKKQVEDKDKKE